MLKYLLWILPKIRNSYAWHIQSSVMCAPPIFRAFVLITATFRYVPYGLALLNYSPSLKLQTLYCLWAVLHVMTLPRVTSGSFFTCQVHSNLTHISPPPEAFPDLPVRNHHFLHSFIALCLNSIVGNILIDNAVGNKYINDNIVDMLIDDTVDSTLRI